MEQDLFSEIVELQFYKITLLKLNVHATRPLEDLNLESYVKKKSIYCRKEIRDLTGS